MSFEGEVRPRAGKWFADSWTAARVLVRGRRDRGAVCGGKVRQVAVRAVWWRGAAHQHHGSASTVATPEAGCTPCAQVEGGVMLSVTVRMVRPVLMSRRARWVFVLCFSLAPSAQVRGHRRGPGERQTRDREAGRAGLADAQTRGGGHLLQPVPLMRTPGRIM